MALPLLRAYITPPAREHHPSCARTSPLLRANIAPSRARTSPPPRVPAPFRIAAIPPVPRSRITSSPGNRAAGLLQNSVHPSAKAGCQSLHVSG